MRARSHDRVDDRRGVRQLRMSLLAGKVQPVVAAGQANGEPSVGSVVAAGG
jgi:hypothetical protein